MLEKFHDALLSNDDMLIFKQHFSKVAFLSNTMDILGVDLNKINLDDINFYEDDPETITHVRLLDWRKKFEKRKSCKTDIGKNLMPVAWHPTRWWDRCLPEDVPIPPNHILLMLHPRFLQGSEYTSVYQNLKFVKHR